jgi:membrane protein DedA with SNARE-associated domain
MEIFLQALGGFGLLVIGCYIGCFISFRLGYMVGRSYGYDDCNEKWQAWYSDELNGLSQTKPSER